MKILKTSKILAMLLVAFIIVGCGKNAPTTKKKVETTQKFTFEDSLGRKFEFDKEITKIAPSGTVAQTVLAGFAPEKMVVISKKLSDKMIKALPNFPADKPEVGQFYGKNANFNKEEIVKAQPEIIIDLGNKKKTIEEDVKTIEENTGVKVVFIELTPKTVAKAYEMLGTLLNKKEQGQKIAEFLNKEVKTIEDGLKSIPENKRVSFIQVGATEALSIDPSKSSHTEAIEFAGGINKANPKNKDKKTKTEGINMEEVLKWNPDFIFAKNKKAAETIMKDEAWKGLDAVKNGKVIVIPEEPYSFVANPPSINKMLGVYWAAQKMYPETFKYNFEELSKEFKSLIFGIK